MTHPLDGARDKLNRSLYHLNVLNEKMPLPTDYANAIALRQEFDAKTNTIVVYLDRVPGIPRDWALIAADALQNMRTALNYVAWELAVLNLARTGQKREPVYRTEFPIADTPAKFRNDYVADIDPVHIAKIKEMQPYSPLRMSDDLKAEIAAGGLDPEAFTRGEDPLAQLRDLTNGDKHRTLRLLYLGTSTQGGKVTGMDCEIVHTIFTPHGQLTPKAEWWRFDIRVTGANPKVKVEPALVPHVAFDRGPPVLSGILNIGSAVNFVVTEFTPVF